LLATKPVLSAWGHHLRLCGGRGATVPLNDFNTPSTFWSFCLFVSDKVLQRNLHNCQNHSSHRFTHFMWPRETWLIILLNTGSRSFPIDSFWTSDEITSNWAYSEMCHLYVWQGLFLIWLYVWAFPVKAPCFLCSRRH
jgi:hypothetical protein